jgi:hypothetical protein
MDCFFIQVWNKFVLLEIKYLYGNETSCINPVSAGEGANVSRAEEMGVQCILQ